MHSWPSGPTSEAGACTRLEAGRGTSERSKNCMGRRSKRSLVQRSHTGLRQSVSLVGGSSSYKYIKLFINDSGRLVKRDQDASLKNSARPLRGQKRDQNRAQKIASAAVRHVVPVYSGKSPVAGAHPKL
eukprot:5644275-Prymnesium_polylepis.1